MSGDRLTGRAVRVACAGGLAASALLLVGCTSSSVLDLGVGDCLMLPTETQAVTVRRTTCDSEHEAEVSAVADTDPKGEDDPFPGEDALAKQAESACVGSFESYVGSPYVSSALDVTWLTPTEQSWSQGDRRIVCLVHALDAQRLSSSVRGSKL